MCECVPVLLLLLLLLLSYGGPCLLQSVTYWQQPRSNEDHMITSGDKFLSVFLETVACALTKPQQHLWTHSIVHSPTSLVRAKENGGRRGSLAAHAQNEWRFCGKVMHCSQRYRFVHADGGGSDLASSFVAT
ncbi:uncharacterized protein BO72DRAFT_462181 [Aspergillus fijiensis CBS 313.89]|uniref:Secreted protein n=1 Tax=Aspergillus fijiensis CBS 313.89 TaxID=1448319 RepID=A0A8G1VUQ2_9EURO|nr:uncharacterized protein BO72DRAFT_462181 [Aspergillus fijiensis CBS 313.89]RAK73307.1 hypothetical protein BO72DRAFT_462181 [Aspergillus fijiensis CBS 313.89]